MLARRATRIVTIPGSDIRDSFVFRLFSFLCPLIILRAFLIVLTASVRVSAWTSGCACRASRPLRSRWSCHWRSRWCSGAPTNK
jgi:hypothetical protein